MALRALIIALTNQKSMSRHQPGAPNTDRHDFCFKLTDLDPRGLLIESRV